MAKYILDFEKPLRDLEEKIEATKVTALDRGIDMSKEIKSQQEKLAKASKDFYKNITRWQRVQMARHPERPYTLDYIEKITDSWMGTRDNVYRNFGMPNPEGYRKALRLVELAAKFIRPVISIIDTPGAYPGLGAEERGQAEAIARNMLVMSTLPVPIIVLVIGEGASGGALGMGVGDRLMMLENTWFSVISPEGCASILYRDASRASEAADAMRVTPEDMVAMGICDRILPEPLGGAHQNFKAMAATVKSVLLETLHELQKLSPKKLVAARIKRYDQIGQWQE